MEAQCWNDNAFHILLGGCLSVIISPVLESEEFRGDMVIKPSDGEVFLGKDLGEVNGCCVWWEGMQIGLEDDPQCIGKNRTIYQTVHQGPCRNPCGRRNPTVDRGRNSRIRKNTYNSKAIWH